MKVVDFTQPFMTSGLSVMLLKPDKLPLSMIHASVNVLNVFTLDVWLHIIGAYIGVSYVQCQTLNTVINL